MLQEGGRGDRQYICAELYSGYIDKEREGNSSSILCRPKSGGLLFRQKGF